MKTHHYSWDDGDPKFFKYLSEGLVDQISKLNLLQSLTRHNASLMKKIYRPDKQKEYKNKDRKEFGHNGQ